MSETKTVDKTGNSWEPLQMFTVDKPDYDGLTLPDELWLEEVNRLRKLNVEEAPTSKFPRMGFRAGSLVERMDGSEKRFPEGHQFNPGLDGSWSVKCHSHVLEFIYPTGAGTNVRLELQTFGTDYSDVFIWGTGETQGDTITEYKITLTTALRGH